MNKVFFCLFGAPGSGKGFLGECINQKLINLEVASSEEIMYLSTGDALRAEIASGSSLGKQLAEIVSSGKLVSDQFINELVKQTLRRSFENGKKIIFIDGYPRTQAQFDAFKDLFLLVYADVYLVAIKRDTPVNLILERVSKRRVCKECKYTHTAEDTCCPKCGGESIIRKDDAVIENRLNEYQNSTAELWDDLFELADKAIVVDGHQEAAESAEIVVREIL